MSEAPVRETILYPLHKELGAKFAPFAGYNMPIQYSGILDEHHAVRQNAGLFDVSHMGVATVTGPQAFEFLQHAVTRDLSKTTPGKAAYTLLCHPNGGTVDDLIVYREAADSFWLVLNASNKCKDMQALKQIAGRFDVKLEGPLDDMSLIALQGPAAEKILERASFKKDLSTLNSKNPEKVLPEPFCFFKATLCGIPVRIATTGYTGEPGCEIFVESQHAPELWTSLLKVGASDGLKPTGLGARDTLRTEMGYSLYGHELSDTINPVEAGLSWAVGFDKIDFVGKAAIVQSKAAPQRKIVALKNASRQAPRAGMRVFDAQGSDAGEVTSGTFSPTLGHAIGLALVKKDSQAPYSIDIRGQKVPFETAVRPFYKKAEIQSSSTKTQGVPHV